MERQVLEDFQDIARDTKRSRGNAQSHLLEARKQLLGQVVGGLLEGDDKQLK